MSEPKTRKELIADTIADAVGKFVYYDRKEDEDLPRGVIEAAIESGEVTVAWIIAEFSHHLRDSLS